eukprot:CAMPEP_0184075124 /NCGR_PEP_ID=MMETSP0957-20130417/70964_1 /TAXON_ID=627963 /ORGANISM="Aplanochytrium sp, Strain PBS07" /LENGTH=327 /DNA_ID=CAMNT_0026377543 /DNA_START=25 /DNA_END=1011 /DNA_ORIENTATION=-
MAEVFNSLGKFFNDEIIVTRNGPVVTIMINTPERMNTMGGHVNSGVLQALRMCADDITVNTVIFTGAGDRAFSAGGDLQSGSASSGMRGEESPDKPPPTVSGAIRNLRLLMETTELLRNSHFVSIAAVNGACAGASLSWACACDLRFAAENALFRTGFLSAGLSGDFGGTWLLPRIVGSAKARELYILNAAGLSGDFGGTWLLPRIVGSAKARELYILNEKVKAEEALRIGLVSKIIPKRGEEFQKEVFQIAKTLSESAPLALKRIKANLVDADRTTFEEHLDLEAERHTRSGYHPDAAEAGMAFIQKRQGSFKKVVSKKPWEYSNL